RSWLRDPAVAGDAEHHPVDLATADRVLAVARGEAVAAELPGGTRVARTAGRLRIERPDR
ncbi:MAG: tRNA(Ile)-lysidine synthetase, partial [Acidimicrobiia bacterium]|nr:tRNA(Ile)-lysidine synthetase [Acidimicrobiia bacterium]